MAYLLECVQVIFQFLDGYRKLKGGLKSLRIQCIPHGKGTLPTAIQHHPDVEKLFAGDLRHQSDNGVLK